MRTFVCGKDDIGGSSLLQWRCFLGLDVGLQQVMRLKQLGRRPPSDYGYASSLRRGSILRDSSVIRWGIPLDQKSNCDKASVLPIQISIYMHSLCLRLGLEPSNCTHLDAYNRPGRIL
jgi:hypothetical protein